MSFSFSHYRHLDFTPDLIALFAASELGAQKYFPDENSPPALRFGLYAPNAQKVEVVFSRFWNVNDPEKKNVDKSCPAPMCELAGGYIADDGSGIDPDRPVIEMTKGEKGCWFSDANEPALADFEQWTFVPYMYRVTKDNGRVVYRTDVYSRCQIGYGDFDPKGERYEGPLSNLTGIRSCSIVIDPDSIIDLEKARREYDGKRMFFFPPVDMIPETEFWAEQYTEGCVIPRSTEDLIIYQLHTAALGFGHEGIGTLKDAIDLLDHLVDLGVNAVEFLPMSEYGGKSETWGYSTSHYFAIEFSGGGHDMFKYFVRECHQRGLAVIMDVVYNHFAHQADRAEWMYDSDEHDKNIYYWYKGNPKQYAPELNGCGGYIDNLSTGFAPRYDNPFVSNLFTLSAVSLMQKFHVDGFRADQTTSIHAYNVLHADGSPCPEANEAGVNFLKNWSRTLKSLDPNVMLIAEDHSGWDAVTKPHDKGGLGFDAIWYADYHHHLNGANYGDNYAKLIPTAGFGSDCPLGMEMFSYALSAANPKHVVYHISHDEAGNSGRNDPDPNRRSHRTLVLAVRGVLDESTRPVAEARARVAFGLTICSPGTPMFLFGEEVGFVNDFYYDEVVKYREDIFGYKKTSGKNLFAFYKDMIKLRGNFPALRIGNTEILHTHDANRILVFRRKSELEELLVLVSLNNHDFSEGYEIRHPSIVAGEWQAVMNSDLESYGGKSETVLVSLKASSKRGVFNFPIAANSLVVLKRYE